MGNRPLVAALTALLSVGLFVAGCGPGGGGNTKQDTGTNKNDTSTQDTGVSDDGGNGGDASVCQNCVRPDYEGGAPPKCDGSGKTPDRCGEDPTKLEWGPASAITKFEIPKDCCFNLNGAPGKDNALAELLNILSFGNFNLSAEIKSGLVADKPYSDDFIFLTEHEGLTSLGQSNNFKMNFSLGTYADPSSTDYLTKKKSSCKIGEGDSCKLKAKKGRTFNIDPRSFAGGAQPQAVVPKASFTKNDQINAGPGTVLLNVSAPQIGQVSLTIHGATIEAVVDTKRTGSSKSELKKNGVTLKSTDSRKTKLGGFVMLRDVLGLVEQFMGTCGCLGLNDGESPISYPFQGQSGEVDVQEGKCFGPDAPDEGCGVTCTDKVTSNASKCSDSNSPICSNISLVCSPGLEKLVEQADLDTDEDGGLDALSAGAVFTAIGAKIDGVEAIVEAGNQKVSGSVNVSRAYLKQAGYLVIHADNGGSPGKIIGSKSVKSGMHTDVNVSLNSGASVSSGDTLYVMLHKDDSTGDKFDSSVDTPIKNGLNSNVTKSFKAK